jgi:putative ABC transport system permease protein
VRGGWRTALRIARRDTLRHKGRSLLVLVMLGLPILGAVGLDVLYRTSHTTTTQEATRELGTADARLTDLYFMNDKPRPLLDLTTVLPAGARGLGDQQARHRIRTSGGVGFVRWRELDYTDPLATGILHQRAGRAPRGPGEVVVTPPVLRMTGLRVGGTLRTIGPDRTFRIVGTMVTPGELHEAMVVARPGALLRAEATGTSRIENTMLVGKPGGLTNADTAALTNAGVGVVSRDSILHPANQNQGRALAAGAMVVIGMAILEVVLLAGPAFAVGARRQQRELGVIAASGASRRDVSAVVLASGLVLGLVAAVVGGALGVALAWLTRPWMQDVVGQEFGPLRLRAPDLGLITLLGMATGMLAALFPALAAARQDPVAALAGRHGVTGTRARFPMLGAVLIAAGTLVAVVYAPRSRNAPSLLAGVALVELGAILCTGALIGLIARAGRVLPVSLRLALRDAARHRGRSIPAVASIMAAVAATIAVALYIQSDVAREKANYQPTLRHGQAAVVAPASGPQPWDRVRTGVAAALPTRASYVLSAPITPGCRDGNGCPGAALVQPGCTRLADGCLLTGGMAGSRLGADTLVGDADLLAAATGVRDPAAAAMLAGGGAVVSAPEGVRDGQATVLLGVDGPVATVPAVVSNAHLPAATLFLSPQAARTTGLAVMPIGVLVDTTRMPTHDEEQAAEAAVEAAGVDSPVLVERGYTTDYGPVLLALVVCSAVVTLGAAGAATGLAAADGRADLATLAAVGAAPRTRRRLASAQAAVIAGLGALFGLGIGFVPAGGLVALNRALAPAAPAGGRKRSVVTLAVPWPYLALIVLVVPVLAVLCAGLLTRSRLPLVRRAG